MLDFIIAGLGPDAVPYRDGIRLQRDIHDSVASGTRTDTVLLLEHQPVYTAGKRTSPEERPVDGSEVIDVDRGGKITWHGPGQLVGYPIMRLSEPVDVVGYVRDLESIIIDVLARFDLGGYRVPGRSGVWVAGAGSENKIASIGVRVAAGVTMHGFALNCSNSLEPFQRIIACGIRDAGTTTISRELGHTVEPVAVIEAVQECFQARRAVYA